MNDINQIVFDHLKRPLNGRSYREIMRRTDLSSNQIKGALKRLRRAGRLKGWDVTNDRP